MIRCRLFPVLTAALAATSLALAEEAPTTAPAAQAPPTMRNFTGTCQGFGSLDRIKSMVGWDRADLHWQAIEPQAGDWRDAQLEKWGQRVLESREKGVELLPILCYSALWAVDVEPRVALVSETQRVELQKGPKGSLVKAIFKRGPNGEWMRESAALAKPRVQWALAPDKIGAWENYVRRLVTFLSAPPYNVRYFQIWNEAHPASSFWDFGTLDEYMQRIHLPAAKIIHELGGKVVYGGWPDCGSPAEYIAMLDRNEAWRTIDVHDLHYASLPAFEKIHKAAMDRGLGSVPIWQTEIGFVKNTGTIPNLWPRFLAWGLRNDWNEPDKYKLFWFPAWTPAAESSYGYGRALIEGNNTEPAAHGVALRTLSTLFSGGGLAAKAAGEVSSTPAFDAEVDARKNSMESFQVGDKKVIVAIHLPVDGQDRDFAQWSGPNTVLQDGHQTPAVQLEFAGIAPANIEAIRRVDMAGFEQSLQPQTGSHGGTGVVVPVRNATESPANAMFRNSSVLTFYVEVILK